MAAECLFVGEGRGGGGGGGGAEYSYIEGTCTVCEVHSEHAKYALFLGGPGGMPPGKF